MTKTKINKLNLNRNIKNTTTKKSEIKYIKYLAKYFISSLKIHCNELEARFIQIPVYYKWLEMRNN